MKKIILLLFVLILALSQINAQSTHFLTVNVGKIKYPFYHYDNNKDNGSYQFGMNYTYYRHQKLGLATAIEYEKKKFSTGVDEFDLTYLTIPLQTEIKLLANKSNLLVFKTGIDFCFLINKKLYSNGKKHDNYRIESLINNFSLGLSYRYMFYDNYFIELNPMLRRNISNSQGIYAENSGQGTAFSYLVQIGIGYKIQRNRNLK